MIKLKVMLMTALMLVTNAATVLASVGGAGPK